MSQVRRVVRETFLLTAGNLAGLAIGLLGTILVTRALGPAGRGVYSWLMTLVSIGVQIALLAPPQAIRAVLGTERPARLAATLALFCLLGTAIAAPLLVYAAAEPTLGALGLPLLGLAWLGVPLTACAIALFTPIQVEARTSPVLLVQILPRALQLGAILALAGLGALDLEVAIALTVATATVTLGLVLAFLGRASLDPRPEPALARRLARQLGLGWLSALALFCLPRVSLLVLGAHAPPDEVGQYGLALALQETALAVPVALGSVLVTQAARAVGTGDPARSHRRVLVLVGAGAALVLGLGALLAPLLVPLVFGADFAPAAASFQVLLAAVWLATLFQLCQPVLLHSGRRLDTLAPSFAGFAVASATALAFGPALGRNGAVLSNVAGFFALALCGIALSLRGSSDRVRRSPG